MCAYIAKLAHYTRPRTPFSQTHNNVLWSLGSCDNGNNLRVGMKVQVWPHPNTHITDVTHVQQQAHAQHTSDFRRHTIHTCVWVCVCLYVCEYVLYVCVCKWCEYVCVYVFVSGVYVFVSGVYVFVSGVYMYVCIAYVWCVYVCAYVWCICAYVWCICACDIALMVIRCDIWICSAF